MPETIDGRMEPQEQQLGEEVNKFVWALLAAGHTRLAYLVVELWMAGSGVSLGWLYWEKQEEDGWRNLVSATFFVFWKFFFDVIVFWNFDQKR